MSDEVPEQFRPRLCHVVKWPDFQGYGFNLHAEKGKAGQFIGKVDENSPAEAAGLKEGDRIVEVNDVNIGNENHQQVVTRIKSGGEETRLLVVDTEADNWYKEQKKVVKGDLPEVVFRSAKRDSDQEPPEPAEPEPEEETVVSSSYSAPVQNGNGVNDDDSHRPRLCHLKLWPHFQGYGFNLHAERDKPGQYIGLVDDDSPASTAGLKVNDRIVEVNGVNIEAESHTEVIARIKAVPGEAKLLVLDRETDNYYRERGIPVSSSMSQTEYIVTPDAADAPAPAERVEVEAKLEAFQVVDAEEPDDKDEEEEKKKEEEEEEEKNDKNEDNEEVEVVREFHIPPPPSEDFTEEEEKKEEDLEDGRNGVKSQGSTSSEPEPPAASSNRSSQSSASAAPVDGLELNLSVAEMKERIKAKKRQDPRMTKVPFEQKYKEFQRM